MDDATAGRPARRYVDEFARRDAIAHDHGRQLDDADAGHGGVQELRNVVGHKAARVRDAYRRAISAEELPSVPGDYQEAGAGHQAAAAAGRTKAIMASESTSVARAVTDTKELNAKLANCQPR